jgi:hypothetical protein
MTEAVMKTFFHVPLLGWALKDAVHGRKNSAYWFFFNLFALLLLAIFTWGYAAVIIYALFMTAFMLTTIVVMTAGW